MHEIISNVTTYLHLMWRNRWVAIATIWCVAIIGWITVDLIPSNYESTAKVYVDTDSLLKPLLKGIAVESLDFNERLGLLSNQLLSRSNLEKVASDAGLYEKIAGPHKEDDIVSALANSITIDATRIHSTNNREPPNLYIISVVNRDPQIAFKIANTLLDTFVENSLGYSHKDSAVAVDFIEKQISDYEQRLLLAEQKLEEFKQKNINVLPEQGQSFYQRLQAAQANLDEVRLKLREEKYRRSELQSQLDDVPKSASQVGPDGRIILSPLEQRIMAIQSRLDELMLKYTDNHPDVIEAKDTLNELLKQRELEKQTGSESEQSRKQSNPIYQQIKISISDADAEIAALKVKEDEYTKRVNELKKQIETLPKIEAQLKALNRDYEINKKNYDDLIARREAALLSGKMEKTGESVKFKIIDPPRVPLKPTGPKRLLLSLLVLVVAIASGVGITLLLTLIKPTYYNLKSLRDGVGLAILGSVSYVVSQSEAKKIMLDRWMMVFCFCLLLALYAGVVITYLNGNSLAGISGIK